MGKSIKRIGIVGILMLLILLVGIPSRKVYAATLDGNTIKNYVEAKVGNSYPNGYCLKFVEECYQSLGVTRPYNCCAGKSGNTYIRSSGTSNIPIGATVYFGNCGGGPCKACGSTYYGHVGIYVGNGYFVHATGGKVQKSTISSWGNKYRGWGYCGNFTLKSDTQPPTISNAWIATVTGSGYTVMAQVSDNVGVTRASCATWTEDNGQDDLRWRAMSLSGNTVSVYIPFSEHGDGIHSYINHIYVWDAAANQTVKEVRYGRGVNIGDNFYARIRNKASGNCIANLQGNVVSGKSVTVAEQLWKFERQSDNAYKIISCVDGTVLDVEKGNSADRTNILSYPSNNAVNQRWYITENGGGYNLVAAFAKGSSLNCYGNDTSDGANIVLHQIYNADAASVYEIDKISNLIDYKPQITSLQVSSNENGTNKEMQYEEGGRLYIWIGCRNVSEFHIKLSHNGLSILEGDVPYKDTEYYYNNLQIGTYDVEVYAKNYLGKAETLKKRITVMAKKQEAAIIYNGNGGANIAGKQIGIKGTNVKLSNLIPSKSYTVSFDADGGKKTPQSTKVQAQFAGWYENSAFTGMAYQAGALYTLRDNVTLYAKYKNVSLPELPVVEKSGYKFIGWYTKEGNRVYEGSEINTNILLIAHWKKAELSSINITTLPQKQIYVQDEIIDLMGLRVQAIYNNGEKKQITNYHCKGNTNSIGRSQLIITYTEAGITKTAEIPIMVNKKSEDDNNNIVNDEKQQGESENSGKKTEDNDKEEESGKMEESETEKENEGEIDVNGEGVTKDVIYEVGDCIKYKNALYTITKAGNKGNVEYTKSLKASQTKVTIPTSITVQGITYQVTTIGVKAFCGNKKLKQVTIGKNVAVIEAKCFYGCTRLEKIVIPERVSRIGNKAFYNCKKLKSITIKSKLLTEKKVGSRAFSKINERSTIKVPKDRYTRYVKLLKKKGVGKWIKMKKY